MWEGKLADRLLTTVSEPIDLPSGRTGVGLSIGIAIAPQDGGDGQTLLRNADLALYRAKDAGRGTYAFFEESLNERAQQRRDGGRIGEGVAQPAVPVGGDLGSVCVAVEDHPAALAVALLIIEVAEPVLAQEPVRVDDDVGHVVADHAAEPPALLALVVHI